MPAASSFASSDLVGAAPKLLFIINWWRQ